MTELLFTLFLCPICAASQALVDANKLQKQDSSHFFAIEYRRNDLLFPVQLFGEKGLSRSTMALLDTGSSRSYLDSYTAQMFRLEPKSTTDIVDTTGHRRPAATVLLPKMQLGPRDIYKLDVVQDDLRKLAPGIDIGMLIGTDLLQRFVVTINYPERKMALSEKPLEHSSARLLGSVPFEMKDGLPTITCSLSGAGQLAAILDTGYEESFLAVGQAARELRFKQASTSRTEQGFNGSIMEEEQGEVDSLRCGEMNWGPLLVARLSKPASEDRPDSLSLLGNALFDRYLVEYDFPGRKLRFFCTCPEIK